MIVDTVVAVNQPEDLVKVFDMMKKKPVLVDIENSFFESIEHLLVKNNILYRVIESEGDRVKVVLTFPDTLLNLHKHINSKSLRFADPELIEYILKNSELTAIETVESPFELIRCIRKNCASHHKLLFLTSPHTSSRAYILCSSSLIHAAFFQGATVLVGIRALRKIFYYGPYEVLSYRIDHSAIMRSSDSL